MPTKCQQKSAFYTRSHAALRALTVQNGILSCGDALVKPRETSWGLTLLLYITCIIRIIDNKRCKQKPSFRLCRRKALKEIRLIAAWWHAFGLLGKVVAGPRKDV